MTMSQRRWYAFNVPLTQVPSDPSCDRVPQPPSPPPSQSSEGAGIRIMRAHPE